MMMRVSHCGLAELWRVLMSVRWRDELRVVWSVRGQEEVLDGLFVLHLIVVDIGAAQGSGGHVGSGVLASVPSGVVPFPVTGGGG